MPKIVEKITISCKMCNRSFQVNPCRKNARFCSKECYCTYVSNPENNSFYGKHHSLESKQKVSAANTGKKRSAEVKALFSSQRLGSNNGFYGKTHSDKTKKIIGQRGLDRNLSGKNNPFYGKKHSKETRLRMSQIKSQKIASGEINPINTSRKGIFNKIRYDSLYELKRIQELMSDVSVKFFKKNNNIIINYEFNGKQRKYIPDFFVEYNNGDRVVEEIKGYEKPVDLAKYNAAVDQLGKIGINYKVIYKCNLFKSDLEYRKFLRENPK